MREQVRAACVANSKNQCRRWAPEASAFISVRIPLRVIATGYKGRNACPEIMRRATQAIEAMHVMQRKRLHAARNVSRAVDNYRLKTALLCVSGGATMRGAWGFHKVCALRRQRLRALIHNA